MHFRGINHLALVTGDMDSTIRFWRDLIGLRLIAGYGEAGYRQYFFEIAEGVMISFFEWEGAEPIMDKDPGRPINGPIVFDHVCIEVQSEDDLWEMKNRLEAAEQWVTEVIDNGFIYSIFTTDPNNIQVEICCAVKGIDIKRQGSITDKDPSTIALEGRDPQREKWPKIQISTKKEDRKIYPGPLRKLFEK